MFLYPCTVSVYASKTDNPLSKLKERLIIFREIPCESDDMKDDILRITKRAISSFITTCLDEGVEVALVYTDLQKILTRSEDIIVDSSIYQWSVIELENEYKKRNPDSSSLEDVVFGCDVSSDEDEACSPQKVDIQPLNEINFSKVVVQNSIFACHLLEKSDAVMHMEHMVHTHFLFEVNKSEPLSLDRKVEKSKLDKRNESIERFTVVNTLPAEDITSEPSTTMEVVTPPIQTPPTESSRPVHHYLIGRGAIEPNGHVVYYVAFSSHQSLREWKDGHTSFEDGK